MSSLSLPRIALATLAMAAVATAAMAAASPSAHNYRYSVINQQGHVFSMTVTPLLVSPAGSGKRPKSVSEPTAGGQQVLGSSLRTAGVYDLHADAPLPVSGATDLPTSARRVGVSIHFN